MASQTQGIQQLLAAEKRAAEKVSEARKRKLTFFTAVVHWFSVTSKISWLPGKQKRLKQAKEEAQDEIEKYRQERERQFKEFEAKVSVRLLSVIFSLDSPIFICMRWEKFPSPRVNLEFSFKSGFRCEVLKRCTRDAHFNFMSDIACHKTHLKVVGVTKPDWVDDRTTTRLNFN